jgi:O-antigen/teichoic acid export membrane protein
MKIARGALFSGAVWTVGAYGAGQALRLVTSVALARLLAPQLFGIMVIVYSLGTGMALISDVGLGQNIVYNKNAADPDFYDTAWSVQLVRGVVLWVGFCVAALPVSRIYDLPILAQIMPVFGLAFPLGGAQSLSRAFLQKRLQFARLNAFEISTAAVGAGAQVFLAYLAPTVWALVFGWLISIAVATIGSYFLLPDLRHRFHISKAYIRQILSFGKWIFAASVIYFLSSNFDRLYLAKVIPLELLGIYGIARALSEPLSALVMRLGNSVLFPFIASHSHVLRSELRAQLAPIRARFLLLTALGYSLFAASADLVVGILYDQRYHAAGWMLSILIIGAWFTVLSNLNESTLLGLGKPSYSAAANSAKFAFLLIGLILGVAQFGILGAVFVIAASDLFRYVPIFVGQRRERFSFGRQDLMVTLVVFGMLGLWEWLRWQLGFGISFENIPLETAQGAGINGSIW